MVKTAKTKLWFDSKIYNAILILMVISAISIFLFSPSHFSIAALSAIVFCMYSFYIKALSDPGKAVQLAHAAVFLVLLWLIYGNLAILFGYYGPQCASLFGEQVTCNTYQDLGYIYIEILTSIIVVISLYILQISYKNKIVKSQHKLTKKIK